jgi:hypothetical protein
MYCSIKEELQRKCTAAWEAFAAEIAKSGDVTRAPAISELVASRNLPALRLRGEHAKASRELSLHLKHHRC